MTWPRQEFSRAPRPVSQSATVPAANATTPRHRPLAHQGIAPQVGVPSRRATSLLAAPLPQALAVSPAGPPANTRAGRHTGGDGPLV